MTKAWRQPNQRASQTKMKRPASVARLCGTTRFNVALLVERKLLPQKKVFRGQHRSWTQTEAQETDDIDQQRQ